MSDMIVSPCAVCGQDVTGDYKCPGPCGRSIHHFCGTRLGETSEDPQHGEPILCNTCEAPNEDHEEEEEEEEEDESDEESMKSAAAEVADASITQP